MCCDALLCAHCSAPVADAGCSVCRATRSSIHGTQPLPMAVFAGVLAALLLLAVLLTVR
jgi:hypothetical protein